jgi:hypothetical protein
MAARAWYKPGLQACRSNCYFSKFCSPILYGVLGSSHEKHGSFGPKCISMQNGAHGNNYTSCATRNTLTTSTRSAHFSIWCDRLSSHLILMFCTSARSTSASFVERKRL